MNYTVMLKYILIGSLLCCVLSLLAVKQQDLGSKYEIGTISDLYFRIDNRIFFRSDDDLFGFLSQQDGSLLSVYELEEGEEILKFSQAAQVQIANNKSINIFLPPRGTLFQAFENKFLEKHPQFNRIIDFTRTFDMHSLILTDKYLMKLPTNFIQLNETRMKQEILIELKQENEYFFSLCEFFNIKTRNLDNYLTSYIKGQNKTEFCFRTVSNIKEKPFCMNFPSDDKVVDVVSSQNFLYVEFEQYTLAFSNLVEFVEKIDSRPLQYYKGLLSLESGHKYYNPAEKTIYNTRIIVEHPNNLKQIKTMKVEEKQLIIQRNEKDKQVEIIRIARDSKESPRNVWGFTKKGNVKSFRIYIEFESGLLVCFQIDNEKKQYKKVWQFTTIKAQKEVAGKIQAEKNDIKQNGGADINENSGSAQQEEKP